METNTFNGIKLYDYYGPNKIKWIYCDVLNIEIDIHLLRKGGFFNPFYKLSEISIIIYDKLGFDLSNRETLEFSYEIPNKNKVIHVWNNLVDEFNDCSIIKEKLSDQSFYLDKYLEGYSESDKKKYVPKKPVIKAVIEEEEDEDEDQSNEDINNDMLFIGYSKQIELFEEKIVIGPNGDTWGKLTAASGTSSVDIFYCDIRSIIVQPAGYTYPYIRILIKGTESYSNGNFKPSHDPYSVDFQVNQLAEAENFKTKIYKLISEHRNTNNATIINQISSADELEKFAGLLQKGIITQEEFGLKKKQILGL